MNNRDPDFVKLESLAKMPVGSKTCGLEKKPVGSKTPPVWLENKACEFEKKAVGSKTTLACS